MKVYQFKNSAGKAVKNQFEIYDNKFHYFQSYNSIIVKKDFTTGKIALDIDVWNYSKTTSKYRNLFLCETTEETEEKIKSGIYTLENLN